MLKDAFGRVVNIGDTIATICDNGKNVLVGRVVKIGTASFTVQVIKSSKKTSSDTKLIPRDRAILTSNPVLDIAEREVVRWKNTLEQLELF